MTQFLLVIFLALDNGTMSVGYQMVSGADLCLSRKEETLKLLKDRPADTYSVQCIDSSLMLHLGDPA